MENKLHHLLSQFCPFIASQITRASPIWMRVNTKLKERTIAQYANRDANDNEPSMRSLHDWVIGASLGDQMSISFLKFVDSNTECLFKNTSISLHKKLKRTIENMIEEFDKDIYINNPSYFNYIAEILVSNSIASDPNYRILEIEQSLGNGKSADFLIGDSNNTPILLLECVSIHLDSNKILSHADLEAFLLGRFDFKIRTKTINLPDDYHRVKIKIKGNEHVLPFKVIPIIWVKWADYQYIKPYSEVFGKLDGKFANVLPCSGIITTINDGSYTFEFRTISSIYTYFIS